MCRCHEGHDAKEIKGMKKWNYKSRNLKFLRLCMNATEMKCHIYLIKMSCPLSKRMGRADEPTVCTSRINTKHIFDGQAGTESSESWSESYPRTLSKPRGTERQFLRHSLGRGGGPEVPLTDFFFSVYLWVNCSKNNIL